MAVGLMLRDVAGYNTFGLSFSDYKYSATLATTTDTTLTVPYISPMGNTTLGGSALPNLMAVFTFTAGASVWVSDTASAAVPAGASFAASTAELNPAVRYVKSGDILHFYTAGTAVDSSVSFYSLD